jgi:hypothetical protein
MRSFTGLLPGESRGCIGCHEAHMEAPPNHASLAMRQPPAAITVPPWGNESIGYERFVQPVLDQYCVKCHSGQGEKQYPPNLALREGYRFMKEPYLTLIGPAIWIEPKIADLPKPDPAIPGYGLAGIFSVEAFAAADVTEPFKYHNIPKVRTEAWTGQYATVRPMTSLSYRSRLVDLAMSGKHYGVHADAVSCLRLIAWVDALGPYRGEKEVRALPDPDFAGIEQLAIRPRLKTAPDISRP